MAATLDLVLRLRTLCASLLALLVGAGLIAAAGADPLQAYRLLFAEAYLDYWGLANTLVRASPILLAALAVIAPLRAGLYNIGGEGQIYIGGLSATLAGLALPDLPGSVGIPIVMLAALLGGAAWAGIAGVLRAYCGVNEVIVTLLMNFIAIHIVSYAVSGPLLAPGAPYPYSAELPQALHLPAILPQTDAHAGILAGLAAAVALHAYFSHTARGFALQVVGRSPGAARYAGIVVEREIVFAMLIGGALAGAAGAIEVIGLKHRLFHLFSPGYGFDGIVVAFIAGLNPLLAPLATLFLSGLKAGASAMQRGAGIPGTVVDAIQGMVVILVAASLTWKPVWLKQRPNLGASVRHPAQSRPRDA
jgi:simple sugar transport system permease protein